LIVRQAELISILSENNINLSSEMSYFEEGLSISDARSSAVDNFTPISLNIKLLGNDEAEEIEDSPFVFFNYKIIKTLSQTIHRTQADDKAIYKQLTHFNIFPMIQDHHELSVEDVIKLCHYVKYEAFKAGDIIYKKGDPSNKKAYLIISGSATHTVRDLTILREKMATKISPEPNYEEETNILVETKFYSPRNRTRVPTQFSPDIRARKAKKFADEPGETPEPVNKEIKSSLKMPEFHHGIRKEEYNFRKYNVGQFFGEASLFKNDHRNETMLATTDCEFVIIDEQCILSAKDQIVESEEDLNILFWSLIPGISIKPRDFMSYKYYDIISIDKGGLVTTQNDIGEYVYIIKEGECQAFIKKVKKAVVHPANGTTDLSKCFRIKTNTDPNAKLFISPPGSYLGEEILFNNDGAYNYTVKVLTVSATFFRIEKQKLLNKFPKHIMGDLKKIYEQKLFTNGSVLEPKIKPVIEDYNSSFLLRFNPEKEAGSLSARSDGQSKINFPSFKAIKSTDNSPLYSDTSPSQSSRSSDDEAAKEYVRKKTDIKKKSVFMKYAIKVAEEPKELDNSRNATPVGSFSPSKKMRDVNNIKDFKLKFFTPEESRFSKINVSPKAKLAKITEKTVISRTLRDVSPRTLTDIIDSEYRPQSPKTHTMTNLATSIILQERKPSKKTSMTPKNDYQFESVTLMSLGKIPEPRTITNLDLPSLSSLDTFTTALKSPRSINTLKQKLELKPAVVKNLGRIKNKT
jgi:CRP-like cAMP-binding protein